MPASLDLTRKSSLASRWCIACAGVDDWKEVFPDWLATGFEGLGSILLGLDGFAGAPSVFFVELWVDGIVLLLDGLDSVREFPPDVDFNGRFFFVLLTEKSLLGNTGTTLRELSGEPGSI